MTKVQEVWLMYQEKYAEPYGAKIFLDNIYCR